MDMLSRFVSLPEGAMAIGGSVTAPLGFKAAGVAAGLKRSGRRDVGLLLSHNQTASAAFFTSNAAAAAPVLLTRDECDCRRLRGLVVNSANANACTGRQGMADAVRMRAVAAQALGLPLELTAVCSTGVIGEPLPLEKVERGIELATAHLNTGGGEDFALAIRTTDRTRKQLALSLLVSGGEVRLGFAAKGAGMISPNMATTLCFVTTDALLSDGDWQGMARRAVQASFNRITVDGQESTNDTILAFAGGGSGVALSDDDLVRLEQALHAGLTMMALAVVADGEGATHTVQLRLEGARDAGEAERVARAIANSPLVKTAVFGGDANWGRVVQAAGQALSPNGCGPLRCDVSFDGLGLVKGGEPVSLSPADLAELGRILAAHELELSVHLHRGGASSHVYFSDLTHDYVRVNAGRKT